MMFPEKIMHTSLVAKVFPYSLWIVATNIDLNCPQNLRALDTTNPCGCLSSMTLWTMAPDIITHVLATPRALPRYHQTKVIHPEQNDLNVLQLLLRAFQLLNLLRSSSFFQSLVPHFPTCCCRSISPNI